MIVVFMEMLTIWSYKCLILQVYNGRINGLTLLDVVGTLKGWSGSQK